VEIKYNKEKRLRELEEKWKNCNRCILHCYRKNVVFRRGNVESQFVIIGEAPGESEDKAGKPFVGKSGKLLDKLFEEAIRKRIDECAFITNVVSCRPPNNRTPNIEEMEMCSSRLFSTLKIIEPKIVILLGSTAAKKIGGVRPISRWRGNFIDANVIGDKRKVVEFEAIPTFHPSYLLRKGSVSQEYLDCVGDITRAWKAYVG
jgi:uracil-DNA glycosylase family 4